MLGSAGVPEEELPAAVQRLLTEPMRLLEFIGQGWECLILQAMLVVVLRVLPIAP